MLADLATAGALARHQADELERRHALGAEDRATPRR